MGRRKGQPKEAAVAIVVMVSICVLLDMRGAYKTMRNAMTMF